MDVANFLGDMARVTNAEVQIVPASMAGPDSTSSVCAGCSQPVCKIIFLLHVAGMDVAASKLGRSKYTIYVNLERSLILTTI